eukprot:m.147034 g.147034  ORF g.147034 m.147034 type:complete len:786 (-) comp30513_c0_seq1:96-2453(-)
MSNLDLPSWYHGSLSRVQAEKVLEAQTPYVEGMFLIRKSSQGGYVLSSNQPGGVCHFQIKSVRVENRECLTFDTETQQGPLFRTLAGVVHYLLNTKDLLPAALTQWVSTDGPKRMSVSKSPSNQDSGFSQSIDDALYEFRIDDERNDYATPDGVEVAPFTYMMNHQSSVRSKQPKYIVKSSSMRGVAKEEVLRLIDGEVSEGGQKLVIFENQNKQQIKIPIDSTAVKVVPFSVGAPPPLPRRADMGKDTPSAVSRGYEQFLPLGLIPQEEHETRETASSAESPYYREVIMEGALQKLPPLGNTMQAWKKRWFQLVVVISGATGDGPCVLEYYDKKPDPLSSYRRKGMINLTQCGLVKICRVDDDACELQSSKMVKKVKTNLLLQIVCSDRTYPLLADSAEVASEWITVLNATLGLKENGDRVQVDAPVASTDGPLLYSFKGSVLKGVNFATTYSCTLNLQERKMEVINDDNPEDIKSWFYSDMNQYGYVNRIFWVDAGLDSQFAGMSCFSTPDAEGIWTFIRDRLKASLDGPKDVHRNHTKSNLTWSSKDNATTIEVFGKTVKKSEMHTVGIGVTTKTYVSQGTGQADMKKGDIFPLFATQAFLDDGFYLSDGQNKYECEFELIKADCVDYQEHSSGSFDVDDLLEGVDTAMMETPDYLEPVRFVDQLKDKETHKIVVKLQEAEHDYEYQQADELPTLPKMSKNSKTDHDYVNASSDYINAPAIMQQHEELFAKMKSDAEKDGHYVNAAIVGRRADTMSDYVNNSAYLEQKMKDLKNVVQGNHKT